MAAAGSRAAGYTMFHTIIPHPTQIPWACRNCSGCGMDSTNWRTPAATTRRANFMGDGSVRSGQGDDQPGDLLHRTGPERGRQGSDSAPDPGPGRPPSSETTLPPRRVVSFPAPRPQGGFLLTVAVGVTEGGSETPAPLRIGRRTRREIAWSGSLVSAAVGRTGGAGLRARRARHRRARRLRPRPVLPLATSQRGPARSVGPGIIGEVVPPCTLAAGAAKAGTENGGGRYYDDVRTAGRRRCVFRINCDVAPGSPRRWLPLAGRPTA